MYGQNCTITLAVYPQGTAALWNGANLYYVHSTGMLQYVTFY